MPENFYAAKDRGLSDNEAFALGTIAGIVEVVMEKISFSAWLDGDISDGMFRYMMKNAIAGGGEEVGTNLINTIADIIIAGDKSQWNMAIQKYLDQGKTPEEAAGLVVADKAKELGLDFLGGTVSGTMISGGTKLAVDSSKLGNGVSRVAEPGRFRMTGWDGRVAVTEANGPNVTVDGVTYKLLGYDENGSKVYQDIEVLKEQNKQAEAESKQADESGSVSQEEGILTETESEGDTVEDEAKQNEIENSEKNGTMKISGARITDQYGDDAEDHAERYYGLVRSMKTDVAKIAKVSGFTESDIQNIKNYIFYEVHDLGEGKLCRFYPSFAMSQSWQRLMEGHPEKHDMTMLQHEILEMELVEKGMSQEEAHIIASSKYNYTKESDEYYGALKEHKD